MGLGRILIGTLCCVAISILLVFFAALGYGQGIYAFFGIRPIPEGIFFLSMYPYSLVSFGGWVVFGAFAVGAFIGGLISKSSKGGVMLGGLSYLIVGIMYFFLVIRLDFNEMLTWWSIFNINVVIDIVAGLGLLIALGAIGGTLTKE